MRIHYISYSRIPGAQANSVHVMKMCAALAANGHEVLLFSRGSHPPPAEVFSDYGIEAEAFGLEPVNDSLDLGQLWRGLVAASPGSLLSRSRRYAAGVLDAQQYLPPPDLFYGRHLGSLFALRHCNRPIVYESHQPPWSDRRARTERALFHLPNFRRLVVISEALRDEYLARFPELDPSGVVVAHDACDPSGAVSPPVVPWPGRKGRPQVGYVGSLLPGKGAEMVVALAQRLPDCDFHLVGGSADQIRELRGRTTSSNLSCHGHVPHGQLGRYYARFDLVVAPLQSVILTPQGRDIGPWTSPLKLFEYMAHSKPIVASDVAPVRGILKDGETACLIPADDLGSWEETLVALLRDRARRDCLANNAYKVFLARHTWRARAHAVLDGLNAGANGC